MSSFFLNLFWLNTLLLDREFFVFLIVWLDKRISTFVNFCYDVINQPNLQPFFCSKTKNPIKAELSEEDQELKDELNLCVERLQENDKSLYAGSLSIMREKIRSSTSSLTSVPKPLKFLREHFDSLKEVHEKLGKFSFNGKLVNSLLWLNDPFRWWKQAGLCRCFIMPFDGYVGEARVFEVQTCRIRRGHWRLGPRVREALGRRGRRRVERQSHRKSRIWYQVVHANFSPFLNLF